MYCAECHSFHFIYHNTMYLLFIDTMTIWKKQHALLFSFLCLSLAFYSPFFFIRNSMRSNLVLLSMTKRRCSAYRISKQAGKTLFSSTTQKLWTNNAIHPNGVYYNTVVRMVYPTNRCYLICFTIFVYFFCPLPLAHVNHMEWWYLNIIHLPTSFCILLPIANRTIDECQEFRCRI